ncbi:MAG: hypothetical protein EBU90_25845 [Proteobacteria bacterium]|nr:hypothetical protein [Pseudomonadota bacterium]NBP16445.1 hypothetical protein [bacterium]
MRAFFIIKTKLMNNKLIFYILLICFPIDNFTKDDHFSSAVLQTANPKKTLSESQKKIIRALIIGLVAGTIYYCAKDNQTPLLQTTVTDYATGLSISLACNAIEQLCTNHESSDMKKEIPLTIALYATTQLSQATLSFLLSKIAIKITTDQVGHIATLRNGVANFLSPKATTLSIAPAVGAITALQAMQWYYQPGQKAYGKKQKFEQVLKDLELKEFIETLVATDQKKLSVCFPDQRFAVAYFKQEANFTNNPQTIKLAEQLENNSIDATKQPLIIDVAAARESQFFLTWILQASKALQKEVDKGQRKQKALEDYSQYIIKTALPLQGNNLTKNSIALGINDFLNLARKAILRYNTTPRSPFKPLLSQSETIIN